MLQDIRPRFITFHMTVQAVVFADAHVRIGEQDYKAGHIPPGTALPKNARDDNGRGFVVRIGKSTTATAAHPRRWWRSVFARVESKANLADAISRPDLTRAFDEGWQRLDAHTEQIVDVLARAASDVKFAAEDAVDEFFYLCELEAAQLFNSRHGAGKGAPGWLKVRPSSDAVSFAGGPPDLPRDAQSGKRIRHNDAPACTLQRVVNVLHIVHLCT